MDITINITYSEKEIQTLVDTLMMMDCIRDDEDVPDRIVETAGAVTENLEEILCLDPKGKKALNELENRRLHMRLGR